MMETFWVILPAAGVGARMQAKEPKQYLLLEGEYLIDQTIKRLLAHPQVSNIAIGLSSGDAYWPDSNWAKDTRIHTYIGGRERSDTVINGLQYLARHHGVNDVFVLVHDAARPLITIAEIDLLLANTNPTGALLAIPAKDTIKQSNHKASDETVQVANSLDRQYIWQAQTPQKFKANQLLSALLKAQENNLPITDESSALELIEKHPDLVEGKASNFKVTLPIDLFMAQALLPLLDNH